MDINRKDIGYTVYSRLEEALRHWIQDSLLTKFGTEWISHVPEGMWRKLDEKDPTLRSTVQEPLDLLEELDIPQLGEIISYRKAFVHFVPQETSQEEFNQRISTLYETRIKVAHTKRAFTALDLDALLETASWFLPLLGGHASELKDLLECLRDEPSRVVIKMPASFIRCAEDIPAYTHRTNLPGNDYESDGGFIGRKSDFSRLESLVLGDIHRVITVCGAGGVGKTALVHCFCERLLSRKEFPFDALVWTSAKDEKLGVTGIEPLVPSLTSYESLIDAIISTFGWSQDLGKPLSRAAAGRRANIEIWE